MISYVSGDLFQSPAQTLVNTVNTVGVMGKGIALGFKRIYPEMFKEYQRHCEQGGIDIGSLYLYRTPHKYVLNFPTKKHWRNPSKPDYIEAGLRAFVRSYEKMKIRSIAFPPLGCGNGELDFEGTVRPIMEEHLRDIPIPVFIYAPLPKGEVPEHRRPQEIKEWLRSSPVDLPFGEVWADLSTSFREAVELGTLTGRGSFRVRHMAEEEILLVNASGRKTYVERDEVRDMWQQLREFGYLTTRGVPGERQRIASYVFPILASLPYVDSIRVGDDYEGFRFTPGIGLQLAPATGQVQTQRALELQASR